MSYTPPVNNSIIFDFVGVKYVIPTSPNINLVFGYLLDITDFQVSDYQISLSGSGTFHFTTLLSAEPTIYVVKPQFNIPFSYESNTGNTVNVEVKITDSGSNIVWNPTFEDVDMSSDSYLITYNSDNSATTPEGLLLLDGSSYSIQVKFTIYDSLSNVLGVVTTSGIFQMYNVSIGISDPKVSITYDPYSVIAPGGNEGNMVEAIWGTNPTKVTPVKMWFEAKFTSSLGTVEGIPLQDVYNATSVEIVVSTSPEFTESGSDDTIVWELTGDNKFNFYKYYHDTDRYVLPNFELELRNGQICQLQYQFDGNSAGLSPVVLKIPRDGKTYYWKIRFNCEYPDPEDTTILASTEWVYGQFTMFDETVSATQLLCNDISNPTNVIKVNTFEAQLDFIYTEWEAP